MSDRDEILRVVVALRAAILAEGAAAGIYPGARYRGRRTAKRERLIGEVIAASGGMGYAPPEIRLDRLEAAGWPYDRLAALAREADPVGFILADRHRKPLSFHIRTGVKLPK